VGEVFRKGPIELRLGDYRDVLADVEPDAVITDPPYGARTHDGHAGRTRSDIRDANKMPAPLPYVGWSGAEVAALVDRWAGCPGWLVVMTSHDLAPAIERAMLDAGRYTFAPVPIVTPGMSIRLCGDGPSSWAVYAVVGRPRALSRWGTLPGAYISKRPDSVVPGGKHAETMRALIRDYSRPGDLVCDPCAGGATTLIAAALEGRRAIGAELDRSTWEKACARIERTALTPPLPGLGEPRRKAEQGALALDAEAAE
jgi:site-specific DNA-methyltransferase (adenine-specific)